MCFKYLPERSALQWLLLAAGAASAALLAVALVAQYGFGLHPCELCMAQRYPYLAVIALAVISWLVLKRERWLRVAIAFCGLLFLADAGIAWYHTGVEWGVFAGPTACASSGAAGESLEEMRREIMGAALVPCDQPMLHVLGLSMAAWNGIAASILTLATFGALLKIRKARP